EKIAKCWGVRKRTPQSSPSLFEAFVLHGVRQRAGDCAGVPNGPWSLQMSDPNAGLPPRYLRTAEAARFLGLSPRTLEKHRIYGTGPAYRKIGARVVYA